MSRVGFFKNFFDIKSKEDLKKTILLALCFFITLGSYTLIKEIKDFVFVLIVGQKYLPDVKNISYLIMIPLIGIYAFLSSRLRKEHLLAFYSLIYGLGGLISAHFLNDPVVGIANEVASPSRIFGWVFYLFSEGYSPFVVSVVWAFFNSISSPKDIKTKYIFMTAASKLGGAIFALFAWLFTSKLISFSSDFDHIKSCNYMLLLASSGIFLVGILAIYISFSISDKELTGYSEKIEEHKKKVEKNDDGFGFKSFLRYPYTLGIFGMVFFWEVINVALNYMRISVGLKESENMLDFSAFLFKNAMLTHMAGFIMVFLGTASLVRIFGEKISLMMIPILIGGAVFVFLFFQTSKTIVLVYIFIRAVNYSFSYPLREALYIPTTSSIRFKTKSWIDSFGSKLSKALGSGYNKLIHIIPVNFVQFFQTSFFVLIIFLWTILAYFMGKRWEKAIEKKEIIGE